MSWNLPFRAAFASVRGAATSTPISVGTLKSSDVLLAVVQHAPGAAPAGLDPAAFTVSNGSIQSATLDTSGKALALLYYVA